VFYGRQSEPDGFDRKFPSAFPWNLPNESHFSRKCGAAVSPVTPPGTSADVRMEFVEINPIDGIPNGFWVDGSLDMITTPDVKRFMEDVHSGPLVLDLNRVRFLDTTGLHLLVQLSERSGETPSLTIRNPSQAVRRVLKFCHPGGIPNVDVQSTAADKSERSSAAGAG
jgi:anti-anti-sigma factor